MNFGHTTARVRNILSFSLTFTLLGMIFGVPGVVLADTGIDGDRTLAAGTVILNRYARVVQINNNIIQVDDIAALNDNSAGDFAQEALSAGDLVMIYQAQGAAFSSTADDATYGQFTYEQAGSYEFAVVTAVTGNDITVASTSTPPYSCSGITNTYDTVNGNVQVIRVPQYNNLTIQNGAIVTGQPWDGQTGGIVAIHVSSNLVVDGTIDVSGLGFRGGEPYPNFHLGGWNISDYLAQDFPNGGEKGESILGDQVVYINEGGRYSRGAPANGGGGGNAHNAGGGGGANGSNGGVWNGGNGFVDANDPYAAAWFLDDGSPAPGNIVPSYFQGGAGGGRGGYTFSDAYQDPTVIGPDNQLWRDVFGEYRRQVGGLGGRPVDNNPNARLFLGGGGGSGDGNNVAASSGGNGGGLVVIMASTMSGSGSVLANGASALDTFPAHDDGAGGGGGGGTIVVKSKLFLTNALTLAANGGKGGDQLSVVYQDKPYPQEAMGPGGGGGGGFIAVATGSGGLAAATVNGGLNGITFSDAMTAFPPNGASQGYPGGTSLAFSNANAFSFPGCQAPTAVTLQAFSASQSPGLPLVGLTLMILTAAALTWRRRPQPVSNR